MIYLSTSTTLKLRGYHNTSHDVWLQNDCARRRGVRIARTILSKYIPMRARIILSLLLISKLRSNKAILNATLLLSHALDDENSAVGMEIQIAYISIERKSLADGGANELLKHPLQRSTNSSLLLHRVLFACLLSIGLSQRQEISKDARGHLSLLRPHDLISVFHTNPILKLNFSIDF